MLKIITLLWWLIVLFFIALTIKNENTYHNHIIISNAIGDYIRWRIKNNLYDNLSYLALYDCIEPYERTLWRLWDWSYKNILPPEQYKIIKPFVKR